MRKNSIYIIGSIIAVCHVILSCSLKSETSQRYFESLVNAYRDTLVHYESSEEYNREYYDFGDVILSSWVTCCHKGVIQENAVAATVIAGRYLDGVVSEGVGRCLVDIVASDSSQFEVLASILDLDQSDEFKGTAIQLAELFFFEAMCEIIYEDKAARHAEEYILELYRIYPTFNEFAKKAGMKIEVKGDIIYLNDREIGTPAAIL